MTTLVAVLDADVLVPILSCDLLLSAFDADLYRPVVTATILDELGRNLVKHFAHIDPSALRRRVAQVASALSHHTHDEGDVTAAAVATVNRKDRHVAATALAHGADLVVSNDRRLRREINALDAALRAVTGDEFAQRLLIDHRDGIDAVIDALLAKRVRRPVTRNELIDHLAGSFPGLAAELRPRAR
jgi:rRNA-processing protein FCF1